MTCWKIVQIALIIVVTVIDTATSWTTSIAKVVVKPSSSGHVNTGSSLLTTPVTRTDQIGRTKQEQIHNQWLSRGLRLRQQQQYYNSRTLLSLSSQSTNNNNILATTDLTDKTIYQRVFYSLTPGSDVDVTKSIVIEERVRYVTDPNRPGQYIIPIGPRTLILRDGNVDDGEIGNDFYTIHIPENTHPGAGSTEPTYEAAIVTALYLASNPSLCTGQLLQIGIGTTGGLGTILGCIGASYVLGDYQANQEKLSKGEITDFDDVLTISRTTHDPLLPNTLERITITDDTVSNLELAMEYCHKSNIKISSALLVEQLEWRKRPDTIMRGRGGVRYKEYNTIIASGLDYTYPEAKEMARTVANRVESTARRNSYTTSSIEQSSPSSSSSLPRFLNIYSDSRDSNIPYLRQFLEKGYKMSTTMEYMKLEKLKFQYQIISTEQAMALESSATYNDDGILGSTSIRNGEDNALDELELELLDIIPKTYQAVVAIHHPDYVGGGSGEYFFPMETGEYDATSGSSTFLEPDPGSASSW